MIWFTSDTHFGHENIIKFCGRPFADAWEMDEALIGNWNLVVKPRDVVYHLGDVSFHKDKDREAAIMESLNGHKVLIVGNHDVKFDKEDAYGFERHDILELNHNGRHFVLCHFPMLAWNKGHVNSIMLHGHSHGKVNDKNKGTRRIDVGVDCHGYKPISIDDVVAMADEQHRKGLP